MRLSRAAIEVPGSGIRDVFDRVDGFPGAISLCLGEPSETAAAHVVEAACESARAGRTRYTNILGIPEFREAAARYTSRVKGLSYDPSCEIQAIDGATIGLYLALRAVVDRGDEVIVPSPFFTSYEAAALLCGARVVTVALRPENGMRLSADDIERAVTPRTRAVVVNSPGNPTGAVTPASELARLGEVCRRHGLWAISDEVYHAFVFGPERAGAGAAGTLSAAPSIAAAPGMRERTIVVESLSKTFAMTGWRIGYLLAPAPVIELTAKIAELMHSSVNSVSQYAGAAALDGPLDHVARMRESYRRGRDEVTSALAGCPALRVVAPEGAFYAFVDVRPTGLDDDQFSRLLLEREEVAVVPGRAFGDEGAGFVRLSYAGDPAELREGLRRLRSFAECAQARRSAEVAAA